MDINSLVSRYLLNNSEADFETVKNQMNELKEACFSNYGSEGTHSEDPSIFTIEDDISMDEFINIMSQASGKDVSEIEESAGLLFEILDSDENGEDGSLSASELKELFGSGDDVNKFTVINKIYNFSEEELVEAMEKMQTEEGYKDYAQEILDGNMSLEAIADVYGEDSDFYKSVKEKVDNGEGGLDSPGSIPDLSDDKIEDLAELIHNGERNLSDYSGIISEEDYAALEAKVEELSTQGQSGESTVVEAGDDNEKTINGGADKTPAQVTDENIIDFDDIDSAQQHISELLNVYDDFNCPDDAIQYLLDKGYISDAQADAIRNSYTTYSEKDEQKIELEMKASGKTREEAIEALGDKIGDPVSSSTTEIGKTSSAKIPDEDAGVYADQIFYAMANGSTDISAYLQDENLNSADIVKIVSTYKEKGYGSLAYYLDYSEYLSDEEKNTYMNIIVNSCIQEAANGNEDAIKFLCEEINKNTAGIIGYTNFKLLDSFFELASNDVINIIKEKYPEYTNGSELRNDINGEWMTFHQEQKKEYLSKIDSSWMESEQ